MKISIIGLGLIGGSMAIDLKKRGLASHIIGVDNQSMHTEAALQYGFVDEIAGLENAIKKSEAIVIATPVNVALKLLPQILDKIDNQLITDVCSTKLELVKIADSHPKRANYVAAHPMAGTEFSGPWAAVSNLFDGKACIFCNSEDSGNEVLQKAHQIFDTLNMRVINMQADAHDTHAAYVSHISHISSFALALTVLDKEKNESNIFDLASGGFRSTVRLAKSSADMWVPIFLQNKKNVEEVLDTYIEKLQDFKNAIKQNKNNDLHRYIEGANKIKKII